MIEASNRLRRELEIRNPTTQVERLLPEETTLMLPRNPREQRNHLALKPRSKTLSPVTDCPLRILETDSRRILSCGWMRRDGAEPGGPFCRRATNMHLDGIAPMPPRAHSASAAHQATHDTPRPPAPNNRPDPAASSATATDSARRSGVVAGRSTKAQMNPESVLSAPCLDHNTQ